MSSSSQLRVGDLVRKNAEVHPERVAAWLAGRTLSYRELNEQANQIGLALRGLGIGHGDRIVTWADTCLEVLPLFVAAAKIGAVFAPLNARLGVTEAQPIARMARPSILQKITCSTSAGCRALGTRTSRSSLQRTISIRSPASSSTMFLIRLPRTPTQAPTQSTRASELTTATFER